MNKKILNSGKEPKLIAITVVLLMVLSPMVAQAGNPNPGVLPVNSKSYGMTYGEWSAEFWKWEYSMPVDEHPLFDTADCSEGQSGNVWFLGGTFATTEQIPGEILGKVTRDCTLPPGKALFFPIVNVECSTVEGNGQTEAELRSCANYFADFIVPEDLKATLDNKPIVNLIDYRVESPLFTFGPLPDNNILWEFGYTDAIPGATSLSASDGVHLMLAPLPAGQHKLHYEGTINLSSIGGPKFIQDITYNLNVKSKS